MFSLRQCIVASLYLHPALDYYLMKFRVTSYIGNNISNVIKKYFKFATAGEN